MKTLFAAFLVAVGITLSAVCVSAQDMEWGDWARAECFGSVEFRLGRNTEREQQGYKVFIQFRSNYNGKVAFDWVMADGSNTMFDALKRGDGNGRIALEGGKMDDGSSYDYANDTKAFIAIGHFRVIDSGRSEDLTRPYEICDTDPRKATLCMMCEYKEVVGCQNDKVLEKDARIVSVANRIGAQGIAPRQLGSNAEELKRKIVENLNARLKPKTWGNEITTSTSRNIVVTSDNESFIIKFEIEIHRKAGPPTPMTFKVEASFPFRSFSPSTNGGEILLKGGKITYESFWKSGKAVAQGTWAEMTMAYDSGEGDINLNELKTFFSGLQTIR